MDRHRFYARWIAANGWAELVGLGGTGLAAWAVTRAAPEQPSVTLTVAGAIAVIAAGTLCEGLVVGLAQAGVLRVALPTLAPADWIRATALGAAAAWVLGMVPSTLLALRAPAASPGAAPAFAEGSGQYLMAAAMGLALGPVLALPQWRVLRRQVSHAAWWIPANALAWALGMPVIFMGAGAFTAAGDLETILIGLGGTCLLAGLVVGAVHGAVLRRLLRQAASVPMRPSDRMQPPRTGGR